MSMVTVYSIFGIPYLVLMPVIARDTLHGTARTYGLLLASVGLGAVTGAFALAMVGRRVRRGKVLAAAAFSFSALLIAFSFSRSIWLSAAILFFTGMTMILNNALANGLLADDHAGQSAWARDVGVRVRVRGDGADRIAALGERRIGAGRAGGDRDRRRRAAALRVWVFGTRKELKGL